MKPDFLTVVLTRVGLAGLLLALFVPITPQVMGEANALIGNSVYELTVQAGLVPACSAGPLEDRQRAYVLHVWYENATPQVLEALQRTVFVGDDNRSQPIISIAPTNEIPMTGKNYNSEQPTFVGANWGRR